MNYPFDFDACLLTETILDKLGFSEYWAGAGEFGERSFGVKKTDHSYEGKPYRIVEMDENEWPSAGYVTPEYYSPQHYHTPFLEKLPVGGRGEIYFLHELYESISRSAPHLIELFIDRCLHTTLHPYISDYLKWKTSQEQK